MSTYFFNRNHVANQRRLTARRVGSNGTFVLPKGSSVRRIYFHNLGANAVTGGVRVGTTSGGSELLAATAVAGNALVEAQPVSPLLSKVDQPLFIQAATAWNGASVDVVIEYHSIPFIETEYQPGSLNLDATVGKAHSSQ